MENPEHSEQKEIEEESQVNITNLSEINVSRDTWYARVSHTFLGWQRSLNRRSGRFAGAASILLLALIAVLIIFSSLHNAITHSPVKIVQYSTPPIQYHFIYRDHPIAMYKGLDYVLNVAWSPDGARIASGGRDSTVQIWNTSTGKRLLTYRGHLHGVLALAWSPDGTRIASGSDDNTVQVWDAKTGKHLLTYRGHTNSVNSVAWSPDGTRIASASDDNTVQVWDVSTGKRLLTYLGNKTVVLGVAWSPDGTRIASGSFDATVQVWNASNGKHLLTYRGQPDSVYSLAWSPDGTRIVSGSYHDIVQIWNASNGKSLYSFRSGGLFVAWSPHSPLIASGGEDGTVK